MKMIFMNVCDMQTIKYDFEEGDCWKQSHRLDRLGYRNGLDVCLYGMDTNRQLSLEQYSLLNQVSDWAHLFVTNYRMSEGFYPLLLTDNYLYFTDREEYSHFDGKWATDNVYKMPFKSQNIVFAAYQLKIPIQNNFVQKTLDPCNIIVGQYFEKIVELDDLSLVSNFCKSHQKAQVEVVYADRYLKNELSLIICIQFIKDLLSSLDPKAYNVAVNGVAFDDFPADVNSIQRLWYDLPNSERRDEIGKRLANDDNWTFHSLDSLPHHRELIVSAGEDTLRIMPDAGLAYGWRFDRDNARAYYKVGEALKPETPIVNYQSSRFLINVE